MSRSEAVSKLADIISDHRFAMLTTIDTDGAPWNRPMGLQDPGEFDGTLYLFTGKDSEKVAHIERNPKVSVAFSKPDDQEYVTMTGTARVTHDMAKIKEHWSPSVRAWFPDGPDDENLRLIEVDVDRAEYWDSPASVVAHVYSLAKAMITGEPADDVGENEKVSL
ncbi:hypothetical protein BSZ36_02650 [Rubricoccus marinus]|uniref:General stress protein FMN-binding split barrel domain-containing protein n=2 Tax=Rubricoccus marinus TaxID=716817 RepID=A0A259U3Z4_9BACT|nr:hypothetical protein BSZ36_02650 [Rubricoccus marinus]